MLAAAQKVESLNANLLKGHFIFSKEYDDRSLQRQFSAQTNFSHNISYQLTDNSELKQQYYNIRGSVYKDAYNFTDTGESYTDQISQIFVATAGAGNVIGGIRLTVSTPESPKLLPIESCGANLKEIFPEIDFTKVIYGEAGRSAVLPDFRNGEVCNRLQMTSKEYFISEMKAEIGLGSADPINMRRLKIFFTRMGYGFFERFDKKINVPGADAELYLWAIDFTKDQRFAPYLKAVEAASEKSDVIDLQPEFA